MLASAACIDCLAETNRLRSCGVLIVAAGMEGALPGVVAGLVDKPVIALPTKRWLRRENRGGLAALLGMLNCCGSGVTVVNIDNGFGRPARPTTSCVWPESQSE